MKPASAEKAFRRKMTTLSGTGRNAGTTLRKEPTKPVSNFSSGGAGARPAQPMPQPKGQSMPPSRQPTQSSPAAPAGRNDGPRRCCPYCGTVTAAPERSDQPCPRCTIEDTPATRAATKSRIGPWSLLQSRNPAAPGMRWATLMELVAAGQVTPRSIVRGPTTHQLWKFADQVKGLSREFGRCYHCGGAVERRTTQCPNCERIQEPPVNPDALLETPENAWKVTTPATLMDITLPPREQTSTQADAAESAAELAASEFQADLRGDQSLEAPTPPTGPQSVQEGQPEWHPDASILSAKELAAAFQLDFRPQPQRRRARIGVAAAILLMFVLAGGAALLYFRPEYREQVTAWMSRIAPPRNGATASSSTDRSIAPPKDAPGVGEVDRSSVDPSLLAGRGAAAGGVAKVQQPASQPSPVQQADATAGDAASRRAASHGTGPQDIVSHDAASRDAVAPDAVAAASTSDEPQHQPARMSGPTTLPSFAAAPTTTEAPTLKLSVPPIPAPVKAVAEQANSILKTAATLPPAANPAPTNNTPTNNTPPTTAPAAVASDNAAAARPGNAKPPGLADDAAVDQARSLWGKAIDADRKRDYAAAVDYYEQIKKLPRDAWPAGLEFRLTNAKRNAAK